MIKKIGQHLKRGFKTNYVAYWNNLSRLTSMLIIGNCSLFFLTELVTRDRSGIAGNDWYGEHIWQVFEKHHVRFKEIFKDMKN